MSRPKAPAGVVVHRLPVSIDDAWIEHAGPYLRALAVRPSTRVLALDATDLEDIDARGVGLLAALRLLAARRQAAVIVRNYPSVLAGVLEAAGLAAVAQQTDRPSWWTAAASNA